ncbi:MAG: hypothetical protein A4S09_12425 [Proteobacteria bacterium SG_bin7]|nr:MAG: hypothetical protein A4S09_12425 [Proteobacteria bacterium SG_bin7]
MKTWIVKEGKDKRVRGKHPWVFANELHAPEGVVPGSLIKLKDSHGEFLAFGYGNPNSNISFRALSFSSDEENFAESSWLLEKLKVAWKKRLNAGMKYSYRLCYSEADELPGLIIDYYTLLDGRNILSCQILTAGMNSLFEKLKNIFSELVDLKTTAIILRNDSSVRKLEGLPVEKAFVLSCPEGLNLESAPVLLTNPLLGEPIVLKADFLHGQKTGLFLDQSFNIRVLLELLERSLNTRPATQFRILDLCSYVGQWSAQITQFLKSKGREVEVTLVDASEKSLRFAGENLNNIISCGQKKIIRGDVLRDLKPLISQNYDIVISDPPAFIKNKKEISQGKHGYLKLNTEAFRLVKKDGFVVSCSCSGLFSEEEFNDTLKKAAKRSNREMITIARGGHPPDHPVIDNFPEGRYLKMAVHRSL